MAETLIDIVTSGALITFFMTAKFDFIFLIDAEMTLFQIIRIEL